MAAVYPFSKVRRRSGVARENVEFPRMVSIRQALRSDPLGDPGEALQEGLARIGAGELPPPGGSVAVAVGSRGIDGIVPVVAGLVERLKGLGAVPFIVPAMGSHGGATARGQETVLRGLGVTEESVGAPVISSMATVPLGTTPGGAEAFIDESALEAGAVVVVNRVAPHTGYCGPVQSGVVKMLAVGLGKREGARSLHRHGFGAPQLIGEMAGLVLWSLREVIAVALVEDGRRDLSRLEVLGKGEIRDREPGLLDLAASMSPGIPAGPVDLLIVDEMGKDISGTGMDPGVTGRGKETAEGAGSGFSARRVVVLGLTSGSGGNATGVGHADIITEGLYRSMDREVTYENVMASGALERARLPVIAANDRDAVALAMRSMGDPDIETLRVVRIKNTRELEGLLVSPALAREIAGREGVLVSGEEATMEFDGSGKILPSGGKGGR